MSTNRSVGHSAATQEKGRFVVTHKKDRSGLCSFTFADGLRQCRTPTLTKSRGKGAILHNFGAT